METKTLKITIDNYDFLEMYILIDSKRFDEAIEIIKDAKHAWELDEELEDEYQDFCEFYESKLDAAGINYSYINYDEEIEIYLECY